MTQKFKICFHSRTIARLILFEIWYNCNLEFHLQFGALFFQNYFRHCHVLGVCSTHDLISGFNKK